MTITTADSRRRGFTLVEVMFSAGIATMMLIAVCSASIFLTRACLATTDYAGMDAQARNGLEIFAEDVRMASNLSNLSSTGVTLTVSTVGGGTRTVTYTLVPDPITTEKRLWQNYGQPDQRMLINTIETFQLKGYSMLQALTTNPLEVKQLQLELRCVRSGAGRATASNNVVSARYVLRNKIVN